MSSAGPPPDPGLLIGFVGTTQTAMFCVAASTAWLLYDLVITFEDEVELIWRSKNRPPKFMYFFSRYVGVFMQLVLVAGVFPIFCPTRFIFECVLCQLLGVSVQLSLMLRVYALWGRSKTVGVILIMGFIMSEVGNFCMLYLGLRVIVPSLLPIPGLPFKVCIVSAFPQFYNLCWIPTLCFESFLGLMNVYSCLRYRPLDQTPTITTVLRDGLIYFICVVVILVMSTVGGYFPAVGLVSYVETWVPAVFSFSGSHLLLNIRRLAAERRKRMQLSRLSTYLDTTHKTAPSPSGSGDIELQRLDSLAPRAQEQARLCRSSGTPGTAGGVSEIDADADASAEGPSDVESLSVGGFAGRRSGDAPAASAVRARELALLQIPAGDADGAGGAYSDGDPSPAESETLPPLALELEPSFGDGFVDRLARRWHLDWIADWEDE